MNLSDFETQFAAVVGQPTDLRPFVCEGSPLDCDVFIVGYNPATKMDGDWWRFWKPGYGYQKNLWFEEYLSQRGELSKTRAKIEEIVKALPGTSVFEANIDARPSEKKSAYPRPITKPFDYVLSVCRPRVVIAHGTDAIAHLQSWKSKGTLIECKHFIYVGRERTREILAETKKALAGGSVGIVAARSDESDRIIQGEKRLRNTSESTSEHAIRSSVGNSVALQEAAYGFHLVLSDNPSLWWDNNARTRITIHNEERRLLRLKRDGNVDLVIHADVVSLSDELRAMMKPRKENDYKFSSSDVETTKKIMRYARGAFQRLSRG